MSDFKKYPYQDYNAFNLDWIVERVKEADEILKNLDANMQNIIVDQLTEWLNDGTLSNIFTTEVLAEISASTAKNIQQDSQIATINSTLTGLRRWSKVIAIGDSIAQGWRPTLGRVTGWPEVLRQRLGLTTNSTFYISALGQAGFNAAGQGSNFIQLLQALENTITDKESVSDIVVIGGVNDASLQVSPSGEASAVEAFCTYAAQTYPNAIVHVGCIAYYSKASTIFYASNVHAGIRQGVCRNAVMINGLIGCMARYSAYDDTIHVDQATENRIAQTIINNVGICELVTGSGTINTALVNRHCMPNVQVIGDTLNYWLDTNFVTVTSGATVKGDGTMFKLCDFIESALVGAAYGTVDSNLQTIQWSGAAQRRSDNAYFACTGVLLPYDGALYCRIWATDGAGGFIGDLQSFNIYAMSGSVPII